MFKTLRVGITFFQLIVLAVIVPSALFAVESSYDFTFSYSDPIKLDSKKYIASSTNAVLFDDGNGYRYWKVQSAAETLAESEAGVIIYHFEFLHPIDKARLLSTIQASKDASRTGYALLEGSTDGANWIKLAEATTPSVGKTNISTYDGNLSTVFTGELNIWLKVTLLSYGEDLNHYNDRSEMAQHSRYEKESDTTTFRLDVNFSNELSIFSSEFSTFPIELELNSAHSLNVSGTFSQYDFENVDSAFDWVFTTPDGKVYQLQGIPSSANDLFGWKQVNVKPGNIAWYMSYMGDWDNDGDSKLDWILVQNGGNGVYKLDGATPQGTFKYSEKIDIPFKLSTDKKSVTFGDLPTIEGELTLPETGTILAQFDANNGGYMHYYGSSTTDKPALPFTKAEGKIEDHTFTVTYSDGLPSQYTDGNVTMQFISNDAFKFYVADTLLLDSDNLAAASSPMLNNKTLKKIPLLRNTDCEALESELNTLKAGTHLLIAYFVSVIQEENKDITSLIDDYWDDWVRCDDNVTCRTEIENKINRLKSRIVKDIYSYVLFASDIAPVLVTLSQRIEKLQNELYVCYNSCPDDQPQVCGSLCIPANGTCCGGDGWCADNGVCCSNGGCCPSGQTCCGSGCCPSGTTCMSGNVCCPANYKPCAGGCIPASSTCCDTYACKEGSICCATGCCSQ